MPDSPVFSKRQPLRLRDYRGTTPAVRYAELHCRTNLSFLEGASHADELVVRAKGLGYAALAITDRNSLAGVVRAHGAAKDAGLKLIIGAEVTPLDAPPVVLLATDRAAYGRLARLLTVGRRRAEKGGCALYLEDVAGHAEGLIALVAPGRGGEHGRPNSYSYSAQRYSYSTGPDSEYEYEYRDAEYEHDQESDRRSGLRIAGHGELEAVRTYRDLFPDRCYLLAELHYGADDQRRLEELLWLAKECGVPLAAAGDVRYHVRERMALQNVLTAIRLGVRVDELGEECLPNAERHLRSLEQIQTIFARAPGAIERTMEIANRCSFSLDELRYEYPEELAPPGETPLAYLRRLAWEGARERCPGAIPDKVRRNLEYELRLIGELRYEAFFLTVYDLVRFARSRGILCQGRGSAANSAVCYCLGVTAVDPEEAELLFERFVSAERNEAPDIDVDFEHERREEVLQYVYERYGRDRAGLAATVITYRARSAIRDVGKALGLSLDRVDALAKNFDQRSEKELAPRRCAQSGIDPDSRAARQLVALVNELIGFPRHLSQHVGGMVITEGPLDELVPIENAAMADRTVIQWDKDDLDELGILKVDCLALGMLTAIRKSFELIEAYQPADPPWGRRHTLASVPQEDPAVYEMISRADTVGVFQIESRAQMSMLPRLKPRTFYDLVIEVAIVRPGPIQGKMVHPYLRRRDGEEPEEYPNDEVRAVLHRTLGVPLFQEQAMQLAVVAAGFTPGEADQLRRAMAGWRRPGLIDQFRRKLIAGMKEKGYDDEYAERVFNQIRGFGEYGFPESHAASFAKLVYVSCWLKHYCPAAFTAALINSQPMGFYAPSQLIQDARRHDVEVRPIDVNHSAWDCTLEHAGAGPALRLGLRVITGLKEAEAEKIVEARGAGYRSVSEVAARSRVGPATIERLAEADAFGSVRLDRRSALWQALDQPRPGERLPLFSDDDAEDSLAPPLAGLTQEEEVRADYQTSGLSLRAHPLSFYRGELTRLGATRAAELLTWPNGKGVKVAGLVLVRQRPGTAKGITFMTLEDETGAANLVIHPKTMARFELPARRSNALMVAGRLERKESVVHVIVRRIEDLESRLGEIRVQSRDFH